MIVFNLKYQISQQHITIILRKQLRIIKQRIEAILTYPIVFFPLNHKIKIDWEWGMVLRTPDHRRHGMVSMAIFLLRGDWGYSSGILRW